MGRNAQIALDEVERMGFRAPRPGLADNIFRSMVPAGQVPPNRPRGLAIVDRAMSGAVPVETDIGGGDVELLPTVAAVPIAPLAEDLGELPHRTTDLGGDLQLEAQEAGVERRVIDHHQGVTDGLDDPRPKLFVRWRMVNVRRCDAVDPLSTWPAPVPHGPHQRVEQDLPVFV